MECRFCVEIHSPNGLHGIEPHLAHCVLGLKPYRSGHNGKVVLRSDIGADYEWNMDSSDTALMFASGAIPGDAMAAATKLQSLSLALCKTNFAHKILLDDPHGELHTTIEYRWPPNESIDVI
jgi:hypothetical protein